jgi:hypothetical protein
LAKNKSWLSAVGITLTFLGLAFFSWLVPVALMISLSARIRKEKYAYASLIISTFVLMIMIAERLRALTRF